MKVVITGSDSGIGKSIFNKFKSKNWIVSGYDLLSGKDITKKDILHQILEDCNDADVFINNALPQQMLYLSEVSSLWKLKKKVIVNISSASTYLLENKECSIDWKEYHQLKSKLDNTIFHHHKENILPYIMNVRPWFVDTQFIKDIEGINHKINPDNLADLIFTSIDNIEKYQILDLVLR
jgi:nucleoside-diphosphate-sugar epimerase